MADIFSKEKRSEIMSKIKGKDTKVELLLCKLLRAEGHRFLIHFKSLPGKPDIVFKKEKLVVFIDGCFWHKCPLHYKKPKSNIAYWNKKIKYNIEKDKLITKQLKKEGWIVLRFWEHQVRKSPEKCINSIKKKLF